MSKSTETIVAAAIKQGDFVASVPRPGRHHNIINALARAGVPIPIDGEQGFLTSSGRFVGRRVGKIVAQRAGQDPRDTGLPDMLFSEDLW